MKKYIYIFPDNFLIKIFSIGKSYAPKQAQLNECVMHENKGEKCFGTYQYLKNNDR